MAVEHIKAKAVGAAIDITNDDFNEQTKISVSKKKNSLQLSGANIFSSKRQRNHLPWMP